MPFSAWVSRYAANFSTERTTDCATSRERQAANAICQQRGAAGASRWKTVQRGTVPARYRRALTDPAAPSPDRWIPNAEFLETQALLKDFDHNYDDALNRGDTSAAGRLLHAKIAQDVGKGRPAQAMSDELDQRIGRTPDILVNLDLAQLYFASQRPSEVARNKTVQARFKRYQLTELETHAPCYRTMELTLTESERPETIITAAEQCYSLPASDELRELPLSLTGELFAGYLTKVWSKQRARDEYRRLAERLEMPLTVEQVLP